MQWTLLPLVHKFETRFGYALVSELLGRRWGVVVVVEVVGEAVVESPQV